MARRLLGRWAAQWVFVGELCDQVDEGYRAAVRLVGHDRLDRPTE